MKQLTRRTLELIIATQNKIVYHMQNNVFYVL